MELFFLLMFGGGLWLLIVFAALAAVLFLLSYLHGRQMQKRVAKGKRTNAILGNFALAIIWLLIAWYFLEVTWLFAFSVLFAGACIAEAVGRLSSQK